MTTDPTDRAVAIATQLRERGHNAAADKISASGGLLEALREACQSVLTAVESLDPSSYAAIEELRMDVDRKLNTGHTSA